MKINEILFTEAVRMIRPRPNLYNPDIVKAVSERYGFAKVPSTASELLPGNTEPLRFYHGKFVHADRLILIRSVDLYSYAVAVQTASSTTDDADLVIDDLVSAGETFLADVVPMRLYVSQVDVTL